ncbi:MAG TPA: hypothetical protein PK186_11965 [candidate division Zixibacteria bacterium]|nr:hypothetical protein [candidate division Zixibacteria bacterium]MDD4918403.1 hypothetical protein [candidate division Zixibacteria bacterium]MDM7972425.1 hypothetical protein [candidate division Zixibacteria bacterium]HPM38262.1 hypothetical protein [candidate division Zixibacteria bacterium]
MYTHADPGLPLQRGETVLQPENLRHRWRDILVVLIPLAVYAALAYPLRMWLVDDAGITFAYARSLAQGHGLVAQPGASPVEGYSNTLWLLLMVPFIRFQAFDVYLTPKLVGLGLIVITFYLMYRAVVRLTNGSRAAALLALLLLAANASFVIWTTSGLENSLYALLATALLLLTLRYIERNHTSFRYPLGAALLVLAAGLTRPDGIAYAVIFPLAVLLRPFSMVGELVGRKLSHLLQYLLYLSLLCGGFLYFRHWYFGDWLPNTYYAKGGPRPRDLIPALTLQGEFLPKADELLSSFFGPQWWAVLLLILVAGITALLARSIRVRPLVMMVALTFVAYGVYLLMPDDWMGEYRFATPFFLFWCALAGAVAFLWLDHITQRRWTLDALVLLTGAVLLGGTAREHWPRLQAFYKAPVVDFGRVAEDYAFRFDRYADILRIPDASVLLPDVGAPLWYSRLKVYDLGRLTDKVIARTLYRKAPKFRDYVFDQIKPTFIHTHGNWTYRASFDDDPRFRQQYIAILEWPDNWVKANYGRDMMSGHYVRRDAIVGREYLIDSLNLPAPVTRTPDTLSLAHACTLSRGLVALPGGNPPATSVGVDCGRSFRQPLNPDGIEMIDLDGYFHCQPVEAIHRCPHFVGACPATQEPDLLDRDAKRIREPVSRADTVRDARSLPYPFDKKNRSPRETTRKAACYSGTAQGEALCVSMRLWETTGNEEFRNLGHTYFNFLVPTRAGRNPWVTPVDSGGYIRIEEYPHRVTSGAAPEGILAAVTGVSDYYRFARSVSARRLYEASVTCVKRYLVESRQPVTRSFCCLGRRLPANVDRRALPVSTCSNLAAESGDELFRHEASQFAADARATSIPEP